MTSKVLFNTASSATTPQQNKDQLPNPLELPDSQIRHIVYLTHVNDDKEFDKDILFNLVSNTLNPAASAQLSAAAASVTSFKPDFSTLKRLSCQMISTRGSPECAHQTALRILQQLSGFSWDAKALIAVGAFCLEYGEILVLDRVQGADQVGNSLKQLNQGRRVPSDMSELVKVIGEVLLSINKWADWSDMDYDTDAVPSLQDAMQEIPLLVYWTVASTVASIGNLVGISDHKLPEYKRRLTPILDKLKNHLENCDLEILRKDDYDFRVKTRYGKQKDVVDLLDILIVPDSRYETSKPYIFEGGILIKNGIEVFKQKYVILFFSGLETLEDEFYYLNPLNKSLQENAERDVEGFKKGDFKILWIPVVDDWKSKSEQFNHLKGMIKFYLVEYFKELPGHRIIVDNLKYNGVDPIMCVVNPQGQIMNENAKQIIFEWGIDAFPFRQIDGDNLTKKWKWFWNLLEKTDHNANWSRNQNDSYVFIYGGKESWVKKMKIAIGKIGKHAISSNMDINIVTYQLGESNPDHVPSFWIGLDGKRKKKGCKDELDCKIQEIVRTLLCLKQDPSGWAVLSRGSNVKILGHAEPMYETVFDFDKWRNTVLDKETSFDEAFREYYDVLKDKYANLPYDHTSSVLATITCPNPLCGRLMEVTSINYRCCHGAANTCNI